MFPAQSGSLLPTSLQAAETEANAAFRRFVERPEVLNAFKNAGYDKENKSAKQMENKSAKQMMELWRVSYAAGNLYDLKNTKDLTANFRFYNEEAGMAALRTVPKDNDFTQLLARIQTRRSVKFDGVVAPITVLSIGRSFRKQSLPHRQAAPGVSCLFSSSRQAFKLTNLV